MLFISFENFLTLDNTRYSLLATSFYYSYPDNRVEVTAVLDKAAVYRYE